AGPADADQRHALADAGLAVRPEGRRTALAARRRDADRAGGAAARLQRLESHAAARARYALARRLRRARAPRRPQPHRVRAARLRLGDALRLALLGPRRAGRRPPWPGAPGAAQVQVDRLHRPAAAPP